MLAYLAFAAVAAAATVIINDRADVAVMSGAAGVSFGPFHMGGKHSNTSDSREAKSDWKSEGIRIPGLQLLGFICHMLPKAPSPHPDITEWI